MKNPDLACHRLRKGALAIAGAIFVLCSASGFSVARDFRSNSPVSPNHDYTINIRIAPWFAQPGGNATLGSLGTEADLQDDLGADDYEIQPAGSVNLRFGRHDIWFDALAIDISASDTVDRMISFGSLAIPAGRGVLSELDLQLYDLRYGYSFFDLQRHGFRLGPTLGIAYLDLDVKIGNVPVSVENVK